MTDKTVTVKLTRDDLYFISESISANVPDDCTMTEKERATFDKVSVAYRKAEKKERGS